MINIEQNTFKKEIPENLLHDLKVIHLAESLEASIAKATEWTHKINYTMNLANLDEEILDYLLWEFHLGWNEGLVFATTKEQKINLIESAIEMHRIKGTPYAIEKVLIALNVTGEIVEWFDYGGEPYHFKIKTNINESISINELKRLVKAAKNVRSWLESIIFTITDRAPNYINHELLVAKKIHPETTWFGGRYNQMGTLIDGTWRINGDFILNPLFSYDDAINSVRTRETAKVEHVFNEFEENLALLINGDWTLDSTHTLDNPPKIVKLRPIQHDVKIFERKVYERVIDGTWYLDGSLTVGVQRMMNGSWMMDGEYLMDGNRTQTL